MSGVSGMCNSNIGDLPAEDRKRGQVSVDGALKAITDALRDVEESYEAGQMFWPYSPDCDRDTDAIVAELAARYPDLPEDLAWRIRALADTSRDESYQFAEHHLAVGIMIGTKLQMALQHGSHPSGWLSAVDIAAEGIRQTQILRGRQ